ncbi:MAG: 23S rRNA (guanosine(2251)-2'-O)-methyltransferase RlmB [Treponema sp.]|nr:23S rRNA (guanosine(2251)-2'-O)-methyltransferase RlmB [Treponema sp.]
MAERIVTGFHAIEEKVLKAKDSKKAEGIKIIYSKMGPRVKKIIAAAKEAGIPVSQADDKTLDSMVQSLPETSRDHRGIVLSLSGEQAKTQNLVEFNEWINASQSKDENERQTVVVLDSVTDPHNVGAIIRSCDQFGASLVVIPDHRGARDISNNEVIARSSAGSSAWVPVAVVTNLVRAVQDLKNIGFWVYGADAGGSSLQQTKFAPKSVIVMGSEGTGIARLLEEQCDSIVSIPTCGKIDSLNVSVAAGVLLYENYRQSL